MSGRNLANFSRLTGFFIFSSFQNAVCETAYLLFVEALRTPRQSLPVTNRFVCLSTGYHRYCLHPVCIAPLLIELRTIRSQFSRGVSYRPRQFFLAIKLGLKRSSTVKIGSTNPDQTRPRLRPIDWLFLLPWTLLLRALAGDGNFVSQLFALWRIRYVRICSSKSASTGTLVLELCPSAQVQQQQEQLHPAASRRAKPR